MWAWQGRTRFGERHPTVAAIGAFVFVLVTATLLVVGTLYLAWAIRQGRI
ncbi:hypothetical protein [Micromonospora chalcea]|nr:hypothetical protein [Micromonospora chalcea]